MTGDDEKGCENNSDILFKFPSHMEKNPLYKSNA